MATRIEKTDLARDALYDKVNVMIDEVNTKIDNKDSLPSQTGNAGKFLTTDGTNASWGEVKQIEIKQDLTNPSPDTVPSTKAVKDESSRITTLMNTKISNCITEIPQDIKLELNNGTLTLKAGSKVYVPAGFEADRHTLKFDKVVIESDLSVSSTGSNGLLFCSKDNNALLIENYTRIFSGSTNPNASSSYYVWYDTSSNLIKRFTNTSTNPAYYTSLPLAYIERDSESIKNISQVFNGFGYIGSTIFALPGVKGLIPNGRNADGSLKSIEFNLNEVRTFTNQHFLNGELVFGINTKRIHNVSYSGYKYNEKENFNLDRDTVWDFCFFAKCTTEHDGKITLFTTKTVFHALDYNDKSTISGWGMPSSRYIDLSLGASGSTYTAPANGYIAVGIDGVANNWITFDAGDNYFQTTFTSPNKDTSWVRGIYAIGKGHHVNIYYGGTSSSFAKYIAFYYAEGESYNPVSSSGGNSSGGPAGGIGGGTDSGGDFGDAEG